MIDSTCLQKGRTFTNQKGGLLIELCNLIYFKNGQEDSFEQIKALGFDRIKFISDKKTDTQCLVVNNKHSIVIIWRGSESKRDWQTNFTFNQTMTKKGAVHKGFYSALGSVFGKVQTYVKSIPNYRAKDLFCTGHSLGGALSANCGLFFDDVVPFNSVWMYGCPRWASPKAKETFDKQMKGRSFRVVYNNDLVCRIPFRFMMKKFKGFKYRHVGKLIYITSKDKIMKKSSGFFRLMDRIWGNIKNPIEMFKQKKNNGYKSKTGWFDAVDDHHPAYTYNAFAKACKEPKRLEIWKEYQK